MYLKKPDKPEPVSHPMVEAPAPGFSFASFRSIKRAAARQDYYRSAASILIMFLPKNNYDRSNAEAEILSKIEG